MVRETHPAFFLVPKLCLGTQMSSKLGFESQAQLDPLTHSQVQLGNEG